MKNKWLLIVFFIFVILIIYFLLSNIGLKGFEKEVSRIILPENIEKIAMKSGIGDSGGNGDYSTYRVVLVIKTQMSIDELIQYFEDRNLTFTSHIVKSDTPIVYVTHCEKELFESPVHFTLQFDELKEIEDYKNYYFLEFIK